MPASPAAWSSSSRMSLGGGEGGGGGEVVLAVDGGGGGEVVLAVDGSGVGESVHVAAVRVPAVQELVPETVCPELHVGWHVDPLARELVQLPTAPFVGAVDASQDALNTRTWLAAELKKLQDGLGLDLHKISIVDN